MECAIEIDSDGIGPSVFTEKNPKARKSHTCYECRREIKPGEVYRNETGIWDGDPSTYKTCADCLSIRNVLFCGFEYGRLWECLDEHVRESEGEVLTEGVAKLTPNAQEALFTMIEQEWAEYHFNYPTQPARRLEARVGRRRTNWIPYNEAEWVKARYREMNAMDAAI